MGRIVKGGRVATIAGCRHLRLGVWRLVDAPGSGSGRAAVGEERTIPAPTGSGSTAVGEERTIPAPTSPAAAPTAVACAIVSGSGSGRRDSCATSYGVIAEIGTDAVGAAHRAAMNASNRAGRERT